MYRIHYKNTEGEIFEIIASPILSKDFPNYCLFFTIKNLETIQKFNYKIGISILSLNSMGIQLNSNSWQSFKEEEKIKTFLTREGFKKIQEVLDEGKTENQEFIFDNENCSKIENNKICLHLAKRCESEGLICKISKDFTTWGKCENCGFPEYFAKCKNLGNVRAQRVETDQEYWYEIIGECLTKNIKFKDSELKDCINKDCFEPITISGEKSPGEYDKVSEISSSKTNKPKLEIIRVFDSMNLHHVVVEASRSLFADGHYAQAIFEAFKAVNNYVKKKSGKKDLDGQNLMAQVFDVENPIIKLNPLSTRSDKDEQAGFKLIYMGSMTGIRNPKAHDEINQEDPTRTLKYLALASLLIERAEEGKNDK